MSQTCWDEEGFTGTAKDGDIVSAMMNGGRQQITTLVGDPNLQRGFKVAAHDRILRPPYDCDQGVKLCFNRQPLIELCNCCRYTARLSGRLDSSKRKI